MQAKSRSVHPYIAGCCGQEAPHPASSAICREKSLSLRLKDRRHAAARAGRGGAGAARAGGTGGRGEAETESAPPALEPEKIIVVEKARPGDTRRTLRDHPVGQRDRAPFGDEVDFRTEGFSEWLAVIPSRAGRRSLPDCLHPSRSADNGPSGQPEGG